ncbi:MAG: hypothetical protein R3B72_11905 [Polyangiaceae bacterium]
MHAQPEPPEAIPPEVTPETPPDPPPLPEEAPDGEGGASAEAVVEPEGAPEATPDPAAGSGGAPELTPEELAEIEAALGADAKVQTESATKDDAVAATQTSNTGPGIAATAAAFLPNISIILDAAAAMFSVSDPEQGGGHDPNANGFNLQQLELSMSKSVDPYFRFDTNIVFSLFGVEVEEAYATTLGLPASLQVRAGQFLTRFGRINSTHPHSWDFADQPFMWSKVWGGEGNRGLGVELSWLTPLPWYVEVLASSSHAAGASTARSFYGADDQGVKTPLDLQHTGALKQFFELGDDWSLMWGLSVANGPNPYGRDTRTDVYGSDLYIKYRPITRQSFTIVSLQTEWLYRRRQIPLGILQDTGGYAYLFWRFAQRWGTAARYEYGTATLNRGGDPVVDPLDAEQTEPRHRGTINLTFWPSEFSRLRLQGSGDFPGWRPEPIWAGFFTFEVVIGSHGAHNF